MIFQFQHFRSAWLALLLLASTGTSFALPPVLADDLSPAYQRRCLAKIRGMIASHTMSEWQSTRIEYLLNERNSMIELFAKHGLLSTSELAKKVRTIEEVTRLNMDGVLTPEQLAAWWTWDLRFDEAELKKPEPRQRLLPQN